MKSPLSLREQAKNRAYEYFDSAIRKLPRNTEGKFKESDPIFHNTDVDAFRHAYVSAVFTQEYSARAADIFGRLNELIPSISANQDPDEINMDLFNNSVGRKYGKTIKSDFKLLKAIHNSLKNNELICSPKDSRKYSGLGLIVPAKNQIVITVEEDQSNRNLIFFDIANKKIMTRHEFVASIRQGKYPGYEIKKINKQPTPVSKRDSETVNNLG